MTKKTDTTEWVRLRSRVRALAAKKAKVKVGVLASAGVHPESGVSLVEIAAVHEFGSPAANIPQRSFIRRTLDLREDDLKKMMHRIAVAYVSEHVTLQTALDVLGQWLVAAVKNTIVTEQVVPRLEESPAGRRTIARKGSSVTLVDHAHLLNAISYEARAPEPVEE